MQSRITIDVFAQVDMRVGLVMAAGIVEGSEKLLRLRVSFGKDDSGIEEVRTIFSGIRKWYMPEDLLGKKFGFVYNLEPRKMMGGESQGMLLVTVLADGRCVLWPVADLVPEGCAIR